MDGKEIKERLVKLPRRAIVAFAARCARRVQALARTLSQQDRDAIDRAIAVAEAFARGDAGFSEDAAGAAGAAAWDAGAAAKAAWAAAKAAWDAAWDAGVAAGAAWDAAWDAAGVAGAAAWDAARDADVAASSDLDRLSALNLGPPDSLGAPIDPSEAGPLGPLWPQGVPQWLLKASSGTVTLAGARLSATVTAASPPKQVEAVDENAPSLVIVWDPDLVSPDDYAKLVTALGDLVRAEGGLGIERVRSRGFGVPCEAGVLQ